MADTFRAVCAELHTAIQLYTGQNPAAANVPPAELVCRLMDAMAASAALLAQPVAEGPTDEEIMELMPQQMRDDLAAAARALAGFDRANIKAAGAMRIILNRHAVDHARAVLARWGRPTPQPVAVSERPWERDGWCDAEGRCYGWDGDYWWMVGNPGAANETITHWLPANALPTPEVTND